MNSIKKLYGDVLFTKLFPSLSDKSDNCKSKHSETIINKDVGEVVRLENDYKFIKGRSCSECAFREGYYCLNTKSECITKDGAYKKVD